MATLKAKTFGELRRVMADLPVPAPVPQHATAHRLGLASWSAAIGGCCSSIRPDTAGCMRKRYSPY